MVHELNPILTEYEVAIDDEDQFAVVTEVYVVKIYYDLPRSTAI